MSKNPDTNQSLIDIARNTDGAVEMCAAITAADDVWQAATKSAVTAEEWHAAELAQALAYAAAWQAFADDLVARGPYGAEA